MSTTKEYLEELKQESTITRKMLERIPSDQYDYRPHPKSMTIHQLAGHIAELPGWVSMAFTTDELDFAVSGYTPPIWNNNEELLNLFEKSLAEGTMKLEQGTNEDLGKQWQLKNDGQVLMDLTKGSMVRHAISQTIHHRAQLGVFLRLLDIPIPGTYGPSADDQSF